MHVGPDVKDFELNFVREDNAFTVKRNTKTKLQPLLMRGLY